MFGRSVFLVFTRGDLVDAATLPSAGHLNPNRPSMAFSGSATESVTMAPAETSKNGTSVTEAAAALDADGPRGKTASLGTSKDGTPPTPLHNAKTPAAEAPATANHEIAPRKKGLSFASHEEIGAEPEGWTAHEDPASKKTYYVLASGITTWEKPDSPPAPHSEN